jgi:tRNA 2-selenouridine synthase
MAKDHPIFDARTPSEFRDGHLPGAINLPLFSDAERAEVGTLYKQEGRREAILCGLDAVGPKMRWLVEEVEREAQPPAKVLVHCWRGGMRSSSLAWLLETYGFEVTVLDGGYKAYRRHVLEVCETELPGLVVVGGLTGCGKTEVLDELRALGEQVIDLEGLANHRGSSFGGIERDEVTQQQFDNDLAGVIAGLDPSKPVWVEDESRMVGRCRVPVPLFEQKKDAPMICLEVPRPQRLERLVDEYGAHPVDELIEAFERIKKRLGAERFQIALEAIESGDLEPACHEALRYYDKAYSYGIEERDGPILCRLTFDQRPSSAEIARRCVQSL